MTNALPSTDIFVGSSGGVATGVAPSGACTISNAGAFSCFGSSAGTLPATALSGTLAAAQEPAHTGDMTNSAGSLTTAVGHVNGVSYPTSPSTNTVPVVTAANTMTYEQLPASALAAGAAVANLGFTPLNPANNGSDFASPSTALANLGGSPQVANLAALEATTTATYPSGVWRITDGAGGAPPLFFTPLTGTCATNSLVNDGGSCVNTTSGGNSWKAQLPSGGADVREWGAVEGTTNDTTAINAALLASSNVYLPPGTWHVTDMLTCHGTGTFAGPGTITVGAATNDFNLSAIGVIQAGTTGTQPGCTINIAGVQFYQPSFSGMTVSNIVQYPPAINADNIHEVLARHRPRRLADHQRLESASQCNRPPTRSAAAKSAGSSVRAMGPGNRPGSR